MNSLVSRKQLLIAESELNRAQLVQEWQVVRAEVHALTDQAKTIASITAAGAALAAGLSFFRHKKPARAAVKTSWWQTLLDGAGLFHLLWSSFRAQRRDRDGD